jgi:glycosyltransferase involved in cell wall biosynthesis
MLVEGDRKVIGECSFISGISQNVMTRLKNYLDIDGVPLYPPLPQGDAYYNTEPEDYILSVGRLCAIKRVDLMIKSMPMVHPFVKLKIVGTADEPGVMDYFKNEIDKHHLWDRVEFLGRVSDQELLDLYAKAAVVYYAPHDEDYGYVTLEGMASSKPILTAHDSGGVLEFVKHEENGLIVEPTFDGVSKGANRLIENREFATELGQNGRRWLESSGLLEGGWDQVVDGLLSPLKEAEPRKQGNE